MKTITRNLKTRTGGSYINTSTGYGAVNFEEPTTTLDFLKIRNAGSVEIKLNLNQFISYLDLSLILNNQIIRKGEFEFVNYEEIQETDISNTEEEIKDDFQKGINNVEYSTIETVFNDYYAGSIETIELLFRLPEAEALEELQEAIINYCSDMFYEWNAEIYQYFIIPEIEAEQYWLKYTSYPVLYDPELDIYLLGITHWGMSWSYFLTNYTVTHYLKEGRK